MTFFHKSWNHGSPGDVIRSTHTNMPINDSPACVKSGPSLYIFVQQVEVIAYFFQRTLDEDRISKVKFKNHCTVHM